MYPGGFGHRSLRDGSYGGGGETGGTALKTEISKHEMKGKRQNG